MANYADSLQQQVAKAYKAKDAEQFKKYSEAFLAMLDDMDRLLATRKDFLLGKWLADAKAWGTNQQERALYEMNARDLITLWGDKKSPLHEYSSRQWSGLIKNFYRARWQQFFDYAGDCLKTGKPMDVKAFEEKMEDWEWNWVNAKEVYPVTTSGDAVEVSKEIHKKYRDLLRKVY